jgi:hypothetical protein
MLIIFPQCAGLKRFYSQLIVNHLSKGYSQVDFILACWASSAAIALFRLQTQLIQYANNFVGILDFSMLYSQQNCWQHSCCKDFKDMATSSGVQQASEHQEVIGSEDEPNSGAIALSSEMPAQSNRGAKWIELFGNWLNNVDFIQIGPVRIAFRSTKP